LKSQLFYRSKSRVSLQAMRTGMFRRFTARRTARAGTVVGNDLVTVAGMQYPGEGIGDATGTKVAVQNAGRPAAAKYTPAYGRSVGTTAGSDTTISAARAEPSSRTLAVAAVIGFEGAAALAVENAGNIPTRYETLTAGRLITSGDYKLFCDGTFTLTLPSLAALPRSGSQTAIDYYIKNVGAGTITVEANTGDLIEGASDITLGAGDAAHISHDYTDWWVL
jgi:hypothetical protein